MVLREVAHVNKDSHEDKDVYKSEGAQEKK